MEWVLNLMCTLIPGQLVKAQKAEPYFRAFDIVVWGTAQQYEFLTNSWVILLVWSTHFENHASNGKSSQRPKSQVDTNYNIDTYYNISIGFQDTEY
jgi:hypothetical protein